MATVAAHPQKTVLQATAFEISLELPIDVCGQFPTLCRQLGLERRIVFVDQLIKQGALRAVALVTRRTDTRTGFPASRQLRHDRVPAMLSNDLKKTHPIHSTLSNKSRLQRAPSVLALDIVTQRRTSETRCNGVQFRCALGTCANLGLALAYPSTLILLISLIGSAGRVPPYAI